MNSPAGVDGDVSHTGTPELTASNPIGIPMPVPAMIALFKMYLKLSATLRKMKASRFDAASSIKVLEMQIRARRLSGFISIFTKTRQIWVRIVGKTGCLAGPADPIAKSNIIDHEFDTGAGDCDAIDQAGYVTEIDKARQYPVAHFGLKDEGIRRPKAERGQRFLVFRRQTRDVGSAPHSFKRLAVCHREVDLARSRFVFRGVGRLVEGRFCSTSILAAARASLSLAPPGKLSLPGREMRR